MSKGRHLKPDFFTDKHIVRLNPLARLLYQGLWCYAADCGHLDDEPFELKMRILPADNCDVDELLTQLADAGRVRRTDGVLFLPKLRDHARIDKRWETFCEACREGRDHVESTSSKAPPKGGDTSSPRSGTDGTRRDLAADVVDVDVSDVDVDGDSPLAESPSASSSTPKAAARKRATSLPKNFTTTDHHRHLAAEKNLDLDALVVRFSDWALANGKTYVDWDRALNTWLHREKAQPPSARASGGTWGIQSPPPAPRDISDDPAAYAQFMDHWRNGRPVVDADGNTVTRSSTS